MADLNQTVRIFISSPADVTEERDGARRVIEGLQRLYPKATLQPVLWEELALPATASFQETIDFLLKREPIDIAVFILWSRLGSPLGAAVMRADGTPYRSGTEREFDLMLAAFEQSGRKRPVILAYVRDDDAGFKRKLAQSPNSELQDLIDQQRLAESFITEQFQDAEGRNVRAYQTYREPVGFVQRLRVHLRRALDDLLDIDGSATWTEEPYRGLETFDLHHAPIFFGREEETCQLLQRLRDQEQSGCAFVVIVGASGSGKSSLARAGVAANLVQHAGDDETTHWRVASFIPALADQSLCHALVRSLAEVLPDLIESEATADDLAEGLAENAALTVRLTISPAFARAKPPIRSLLILDQMEELWTDRHTTAEDRDRFLSAIEALARSGHVAVLATLRSDFYHHAQQSTTFLRLKGERGHYDLLPPDAASIHRLISEPARLSGLKFERNEQSGRSLDEVILEDASRDPNALPLLEYTLSELYRQRDENRHLMTYAAYVHLGGVEGAIGKRADETFASLPPDARDALDEILPLLVSVDVGGEQSAVRRRASLAELTSTPARRTLTKRLIAERFLTTDRQDETPIASLAHEALLRSWVRIVGWINANREQLRLRARVEQTQQRWEQQDRDASLLLHEGLPLDEGRQLLRDAPYLLAGETAEYIRASVEHQQRREQRSRRQRRAVLSTIAALLLMMIAGGIFLQRQGRAAEAKEKVRRLLQAETSQVPSILPEFASYRDLAHSDLRTAFHENADESNEKLHAGLALIDEDASMLPFLTDRLLTAKPDQVATIIEILKDHKEQITDELWQVVEAEDPASLLQAASALAVYDVESNSKWTSASARIADTLVRENALRVAVWIKTLSPARRYLISPLSDVYRDKSEDREQTQIDLATELLEEYAADDVEILTELILDASPKQFNALFDELKAHGAEAIARMETAISETLAGRQANAAAALARLGKREELLGALRIKDDPESLTQFVHRCRGDGVTSLELLECLEVADRSRQSLSGESRRIEARVLFGLLLALGEEFDLKNLPSEKQQFVVDQVERWYRDDPSSAVHGASGWLLRRWGMEDAVLRVDHTPIPFDGSYEREWFVIEVTPEPNKPNSGLGGLLGSLLGGNTSERAAPIYMTMIVIPPGDYDIGSPVDEPGHEADETLNRVRLTRPVAILDREVTRGEFDASGVVSVNVAQYSPTAEHPMVAPSWYDSVQYCRWLTKQAEFTEADQAYGDPSKLDPSQHARDGETGLPKNWPVKLDAKGFRLPTEAEWEIAARGGMRTMYGFGGDETLLKHYAWYQENGERQTHIAKQLRPNLRGWFDMHGSVFEWCHDWYAEYPSGSRRTDPFGSSAGSGRVFRGGSWDYGAAGCRTAYRNRIQPAYRGYVNGLRVALVPFVPAQQVAEPESEGPEGASGAASEEAERPAESDSEQTLEK